MKGLVFTELVDMVEGRFSPLLADRMIARAALPNGGAYTSVGTYDHSEMARLVRALSVETGKPAGQLLGAFGEHMAGRFRARFPKFFEASSTLLDFLASIDSVIHVEVRKLYHDAELPSFIVEARDEHSMTLLYRSSRHLEDMAEGLMRGCAAHYGEAIEICRESVVTADGGTATRFRIRRNSP